MPIVDVRSLPPPDEGAVERLIALVPARLAAAIGCPVEDVWVYFSMVDAARIGADRRSWLGHCPVAVVRARVRSEDAVAQGLEAVAKAVAEAFALPVEDIWIHWVDLPPRRVFAGGGVR